jgi:ubiquinol-cytochrome c reductase iron-sulfur subunit
VGALGVAALFPIRSLGPRPGKGLLDTGYGAGTRLVTSDGEPLRPGDLPEGGVVTAWPEGDLGAADSPTLVINVGGSAVVQHQPGREDWLVGSVIAYSKLCTHTGCPVGLYQQDEQLLLCPCHQSTFDVLDGARPVFGPANRPLPQLPLAVDDDGYLVSTGEFSDAVGASFWDRPRSVDNRDDQP